MVDLLQETPKKSSNLAKCLPCDDKSSLSTSRIASSIKIENGDMANASDYSSLRLVYELQPKRALRETAPQRSKQAPAIALYYKELFRRNAVPSKNVLSAPP